MPAAVLAPLAQQGLVQFGPHWATFVPFAPHGLLHFLEQPGFAEPASVSAVVEPDDAPASDVSAASFFAQQGFLQSGPHLAVPSGFLHGVLHWPAHLR